ncbi:replication initiation protein [Hahella ganghwensis]|uniref:replication initiation protein n=1 Tax=Hahella ganghwensis TaxID=286420 RepID=UPI0003800105|nr:replication initiation protein [Hahella ganghwensis]
MSSNEADGLDFLNSPIVQKSNYLIEANDDYTANEHKFLDQLIADHREDDPEDKDYFFEVRKLLKAFGIGSENHHKLKQMTNKIQSKVIPIFYEGKERRVNILYHCTYHHNEGLISTRFHPDILPHIKGLAKKGHYTKYYLANVHRLSVKYSIKTYTLLQQYRKIGYRYFEYEDFREKLGIPLTGKKAKYSQYGDFKKRVLIPVVSEINNETDLSVDFEERKIGKRVIGLKFLINPNEENSERIRKVVEQEYGSVSYEVIDAEVLDEELGLAEELTDLLRCKKFTASKIIDQYPEEQVRAAISVYKQRCKGTEIKAKSAYFKKLLQEGVSAPSASGQVPKRALKDADSSNENLQAKKSVEQIIKELEAELKEQNREAVQSFLDNRENDPVIEVLLGNWMDVSLFDDKLRKHKKELLNPEVSIIDKLSILKQYKACWAAFMGHMKEAVVPATKKDLVVFAKTKGINIKRQPDESYVLL